MAFKKSLNNNRGRMLALLLILKKVVLNFANSLSNIGINCHSRLWDICLDTVPLYSILFFNWPESIIPDES